MPIQKSIGVFPMFALRQGIATSVLLAFSGAVSAAPTGGQVVAGQAVITQAGTSTTITQSTNRAAINWQAFGIAANETVRFSQPSASSIALNRVLGQDPSAILGSLSANHSRSRVQPDRAALLRFQGPAGSRGVHEHRHG